PHGVRARDQEVLADVPLGERVQVAPLKGQVLDQRPVQGARGLLTQHGQRRVEELHAGSSSWARGRISLAITSTIDQSNTANGSDAAFTIISSTPNSANPASRSTHCSTVPVSVGLDHSSSDSPAIAPPGVHRWSAS